jgi:hypothetical protein
VDDKTLRKKLIRLAYKRPELRDEILPLVMKKGGLMEDLRSGRRDLERRLRDLSDKVDTWFDASESLMYHEPDTFRAQMAPYTRAMKQVNRLLDKVEGTMAKATKDSIAKMG